MPLAIASFYGQSAFEIGPFLDLSIFEPSLQRHCSYSENGLGVVGDNPSFILDSFLDFLGRGFPGCNLFDCELSDFVFRKALVHDPKNVAFELTIDITSHFDGLVDFMNLIDGQFFGRSCVFKCSKKDEGGNRQARDESLTSIEKGVVKRHND